MRRTLAPALPAAAATAADLRARDRSAPRVAGSAQRRRPHRVRGCHRAALPLAPARRGDRRDGAGPRAAAAAGEGAAGAGCGGGGPSARAAAAGGCRAGGAAHPASAPAHTPQNPPPLPLLCRRRLSRSSPGPQPQRARGRAASPVPPPLPPRAPGRRPRQTHSSGSRSRSLGPAAGEASSASGCRRRSGCGGGRRRGGGGRPSSGRESAGRRVRVRSGLEEIVRTRGVAAAHVREQACRRPLVRVRDFLEPGVL